MQSPSNPFLCVSCDKCKVPINSDTRFEYLCGHIICRVCDTGRTCNYCGHPGPANQLSNNERNSSDICEACEDTALYYCVTCPKLLCERCAHIHSVNPSRREHQVVYLRDYPRQIPADGLVDRDIPEHVYLARKRVPDQDDYSYLKSETKDNLDCWNRGVDLRRPFRKTPSLTKQFSYSKSVSSRASSVHSVLESTGKASEKSTKSEKSVVTDVSGLASMIQNSKFTIMVYNNSDNGSSSSGNLKQIQTTRSREYLLDNCQNIIPEEKESLNKERSKMSENGEIHEHKLCRRASNASITSNASYSSHCCGSHLDELSKSRSISIRAPQSEMSKSDTMDDISDIINDGKASLSSQDSSKRRTCNAKSNFPTKINFQCKPSNSDAEGEQIDLQPLVSQENQPEVKTPKKRFSYQQQSPTVKPEHNQILVNELLGSNIETLNLETPTQEIESTRSSLSSKNDRFIDPTNVNNEVDSRIQESYFEAPKKIESYQQKSPDLQSSAVRIPIEELLDRDGESLSNLRLPDNTNEVDEPCMRPEKLLISTSESSQSPSPLVERVRNHSLGSGKDKIEFIDEDLYESPDEAFDGNELYLTHSSTYSDPDILSNIVEEPALEAVSPAQANICNMQNIEDISMQKDDVEEGVIIMYDDDEEMVFEVETLASGCEKNRFVISYEKLQTESKDENVEICPNQCFHSISGDPPNMIITRTESEESINKDSAGSRDSTSQKRKRSLTNSNSIPISAVSKDSFITASSCNEFRPISDSSRFLSASSDSICSFGSRNFYKSFESRDTPKLSNDESGNIKHQENPFTVLFHSENSNLFCAANSKKNTEMCNNDFLESVSGSSGSILSKDEYCKDLHPLLTFSDYEDDDDEPNNPTSIKRIMLDRIIGSSYHSPGENLGFMENLKEDRHEESLTGVSSLPADKMDSADSISYPRSQDAASDGYASDFSMIWKMREVGPLSVTKVNSRRCKNVVIGEEPEDTPSDPDTVYFACLADYVEWSQNHSLSEVSSVASDMMEPSEIVNMIDISRTSLHDEEYNQSTSEENDAQKIDLCLDEESISSYTIEATTISVHSFDASSIASTIVDSAGIQQDLHSSLPLNLESDTESSEKLNLSNVQREEENELYKTGSENSLSSSPSSVTKDLGHYVDKFNDAMTPDLDQINDIRQYVDAFHDAMEPELISKKDVGQYVDTYTSDKSDAKLPKAQVGQNTANSYNSPSKYAGTSEDRSKCINDPLDVKPEIKLSNSTDQKLLSTNDIKALSEIKPQNIEKEPFKRKYSKRVSALKGTSKQISATLPRNKHASNNSSEKSAKKTYTLPRKQQCRETGEFTNFLTQTYKDRGASPRSNDESRLLSRSLTFGSASDYKKFAAEELQWERSLPRHLGRRVYMRNPSLKQVDWSVMGRKGTEPGFLMNPTGIAVDEGCVAIAEEGNGRIQIFIEDESEYCINNLVNPCGIALSPEYIYVSDIDTNVIQIYGRNALQVAELGGPGSQKGQFSEPRGIAINPSNGDLAVCDTENHRVQIFDVMGNYLKSLGGKGKSRGEFREPISCCYDNWGRLLVSDHCNYRVQLFDTHYQYITDFGKYGKSSGEFWGVNGICSHRNGDILVVDSDNNCLSVHSSDGRFISVFGRRGAERWEFLYPHSVASDEVGNVYVSDWGNHRIHIMDKKLLPYLELESHML